MTPSANPTGIRPVEETSPQIHLEQRDEGGRPLPRSMAGQPRRAQRKSWFVLLLAVGLLQAPILAQAMVVDVGTPLEEGIETNFGKYLGKMDIISSLATLSYDKRRSEFFSKELLILLILNYMGLKLIFHGR